ncbi:MAG: hypothetical protein INR73_04595 [Williamsia sp.]|nr:hypothetical protein [Williamsia sp.]
MNKQDIAVKTFLWIGFLLIAAGSSVQAQDSSKRKTIEVTSSFKPVLREAAKINFNAVPPPVDSSRPVLQYNVPSQNLFFTYQPAALKPVALQTAPLSNWQQHNYVKAGVGSVVAPYLEGGFSYQKDSSTNLNAFAHSYASKGDLPFQKNNQTGVTLAGTFRTPGSNEWNARLGFTSDDYYFYGYRPTTLSFTKSQLLQRFQTVEGKLGFRNTVPTEYGLLYNPNLNVSVFSGKNSINKATEANTVLNLPLEKSFDEFAIKLGFGADLTSYRPSGKNNIQNNLFTVSPSVAFKSSNVHLQLGIMPSWDNKAFKMLPDIMADITTEDQRFTVQAGWIGHYDKGSYQRFASVNPWIAQPGSLLNTRVVERYAGFKGSVLNHITYSTKVAFNSYRNMALFVNDSTDGKTFTTVYASSLNAFQLHGEIGFTQGEIFNAKAGLNINQYLNVKGQDKAWGMIPLELTAAIRWQLFKDFWLKSELYAFDGAQYRDVKTRKALKGESGLDLNAGAEFKITKQFNLWLQLNNLFNSKYERWNQYQVYGFNVLGGVAFSF